MGFLDERRNNDKEKEVNIEKIEKLIEQMQSDVTLKMKQQDEKMAELLEEIKFLKTTRVTAMEMTDRDNSIKEKITENNIWTLGIGIILSVLMIICTAWIDWNTIEEDKNHTVEKIIKQNYVDTQNVWWQNETMQYNRNNGTYLTVEEYRKMRMEQQKAQ